MRNWIQKGNRQIVIVAVAIGVMGFLFQIALQMTLRPFTADGIHFQAWSSEKMMQTVALDDLYAAPLETLWNIHIQPPALDAIRSVLVRIWPSTDPLVAVSHVDMLLYGVWSLLYGLLGSLVFVWMYELTEMKVAIVAAFALLLHPASIFYATFLETTLLAALLITLMYYLLWRISRNANVSFLASSLVVLTLLFTRSIFQWPYILLFAASLFMVGMKKRSVVAFMTITIIIFGLYLIKQHNKFGIWSTSSFTGLNLTRSVSIGSGVPNYWGYLNGISDVSIDSELPKVLTRTKKANGAINFNHISYLALNRQLTTHFLEYIKAAPIGELARGYLENLKIYFRPSSAYTAHVIVDRLPWRSVYNRVFSSRILFILITIAGLLALRRAAVTRQPLRYIGLALPAAYIFAISVLAERGENMRFKFFIEPVIIVFLIFQFYDAWHRIRAGEHARAMIDRFLRVRES
jgi:hypothetical protein